MVDIRDKAILSLLQESSDMTVDEIADRIALSPSACSRRIQRLEAEGYIAKRVALLNRASMNLPTTIFVVIKTSQHSVQWLDKFRAAISSIPEIVEVHRLTGNFDYILKIILPNVEYYDVIYRQLITRVEMFDVAAHISMETVKFETAIPTSYA